MADKHAMYIEGRKLSNFADIQRNYCYEITFNTAYKLINGWNDESLTLRARSFSIPSRGNEPIQSHFGAMSQFFPGKPTFGNTMQIQFEETESQGVQRFLNAWQNRIFNLNMGHAGFARKRGTDVAGNRNYIGTEGSGICDLVTIKAFRYNGEELKNRYYLVNAWIQNVDDVNIDYSQNESIKFNMTLQFDFWTFGANPPAFTAAGNTAAITLDPNSTVSE